MQGGSNILHESEASVDSDSAPPLRFNIGAACPSSLPPDKIVVVLGVASLICEQVAEAAFIVDDSLFDEQVVARTAAANDAMLEASFTTTSSFENESGVEERSRFVREQTVVFDTAIADVVYNDPQVVVTEFE